MTPQQMTVIINIQSMQTVIYGKPMSLKELEKGFDLSQLYELQEQLIPLYNKAIAPKNQVKMKTSIKEPELLVNDAHGIYIGQMFAKSYGPYITNMAEVEPDYLICLDGPDNEHYLDAWVDLVDNVQLTNDKGEKFTVGNLGESGDLWAIPEGYEYPED